MKKAYLVLSDGTVFEAYRFGYEADTVGELVFTTGMEGYIETLTDPSYAGQIVIQTFPLIGNYGVIKEDFEGESFLKGYIVREYCDTPSNFRCDMTLDAYLKEKHIPGLYGIDTRELTRIIREHGVINAGIFDEVPDDLSVIKQYAVKGVVAMSSCKKAYVVKSKGEVKHHVTLIDYGAKKNIARELSQRGCEVKVVPYNTTAEEILQDQPDGVMLSNGPGDPKENVESIEQLKKIIGKVPVFGICLGHQLTALSQGGDTFKMKYGHRGLNQPVTDLVSGRTFITTQNHGYAVDTKSLEGKAQQVFVNANDGTCEGVYYPDKNCLTVQFHPEACAGPKDTEFLFNRFLTMMEGGSHAKRS